MKQLIFFLAFAVWVAAVRITPVSAAEKQPLVDVYGRTIIAFFPPVADAELRKHPDTNEALADFQLYATRVREPLKKAGVEFHELYTRSFRIRVGKAVISFRITEPDVGYYFIVPGKQPRLEYGVMTDADLLQVANEYFRPSRVVALPLSAQGSKWNVFTSRGGWSISYPADWRISSCQSCRDPATQGVFGGFSPRSTETPEGFVMVEPLADKPLHTSVDAWLTDISRHNNVNLHIEDEKYTLNDLPALKVRYRTATGEEMESLYVVRGSDTFALNFDLSGKTAGVPLEKLNAYVTYLKMLTTFRVK